MNLKLWLIISLMIALTAPAYGQGQKKRCKQFLKSEVYQPGDSVGKIKQNIETDLVNYFDCGLDTIDVFILSQITEPLLVGQLIAHATGRESRPVTYGEILDSFNAFRQKMAGEYQQIRKAGAAAINLLDIPAERENWTLAKELLATIGMNEAEINQFYSYLDSANAFNAESYIFSLNEYNKFRKAQEKLKTQQRTAALFAKAAYCDSIVENENLVLGLAYYSSLEPAIECSKRLKKPILIYFNCWSCVNARRMEDHVWSDSVVKRILNEDLILVFLYADDRSSLPEQGKYFSEPMNKTIETVGKQIMAFQSSKFGKNSQPWFVIADSNINPFAQIGYCSTEAFLEFLNKGIEAYNSR